MDKVQIFNVTKNQKANKKHLVKWKVNERHHTRAFSTKARAEVFRKELDKANDAGVIFSADNGEPRDWIKGRKHFAKVVQEYSGANWKEWGQRHKKGVSDNLGLVMFHFLTPSGQKRYSRQDTKEFVKKYLVQEELPKNMSAQDEYDLDKFIKATYYLGDITPSLLKKILTSLSQQQSNPNKTISAVTLKNRKQVINAVLQHAYESEDISKNPMNTVKSKKLPSKSITSKDVLSPDRCRDLQSEVKNLKDLGPQISQLIGIMWLAGLRPSEAVALKKSHFHLSAKGSYIQVEQASVTVGKEFGDDIKVGRKTVRTSTVLKQLKARGEGDFRKVPINKELKKQITQYLKQFKDDEYVFPLWEFSRQFVVDQNGKKVMKRNGTGPLWTIQKTVDLSRPMLTDTIHHYIQKTSLNGVKPYDLRHTNASILIYSGLNIVEIASRLGHSVQVCQSVYLHLIEDEKPFDTSREDGFLKG